MLGDTLSYIQQEYKPKKVIDVATLTGACIGRWFSFSLFIHTAHLTYQISVGFACIVC